MKAQILFLLVFVNLQLSAAKLSNSAPTQHPETPLTQKILKRLIDARGIPLKNGMPKVDINTEKVGNSPAKASINTNTLILSPKIITVCKNFGEYYEDVLAAIIGHELIHFYQQNECRFTYENKKVDSLEREADVQGLLNAYLAGYRIKGEGSATLQSRLIDSIYAAFNLKEDYYGYPSKEERKRMVEEAERIIDELLQLFETANYAILRGKFQLAIEIYDYLLSILNAKEFHQNISIAYASLYKRLYQDTFEYPFELNTYSRLYNKVRGDEDIVKEVIKDKALQHFCAGASNSNEELVFQATLALIRGELSEAKNMIKDLREKGIPKANELLKILNAKEKGEKPALKKTTGNHFKPVNCGRDPIFGGSFNANKQLTPKLSIRFYPPENVIAIRFNDKRFIVQYFRPTCESLDADYEIPHSRGNFHIFIKDSQIFIEKHGIITQGAWIYPEFPE